MRMEWIAALFVSVMPRSCALVARQPGTAARNVRWVQSLDSATLSSLLFPQLRSQGLSSPRLKGVKGTWKTPGTRLPFLYLNRNTLRTFRSHYNLKLCSKATQVLIFLVKLSIHLKCETFRHKKTVHCEKRRYVIYDTYWTRLRS